MSSQPCATSFSTSLLDFSLKEKKNKHTWFLPWIYSGRKKLLDTRIHPKSPSTVYFSVVTNIDPLAPQFGAHWQIFNDNNGA